MIQQETRFDKDGKCIYAKLKVRKKFTDFNYECDIEKSYLEMKIGELDKEEGLLSYKIKGKAIRFWGNLILFLIFSYSIFNYSTFESIEGLYIITPLIIFVWVKTRTSKLISTNSSVQVLVSTFLRIKRTFNLNDVDLIGVIIPATDEDNDNILIGFFKKKYYITKLSKNKAGVLDPIFGGPHSSISSNLDDLSLSNILLMKSLMFTNNNINTGFIGKVIQKSSTSYNIYYYYFLNEENLVPRGLTAMWSIKELKQFDLNFLKNDARFYNWDEIIKELENEPEQNWIDANIINRLKYGSEK